MKTTLRDRKVYTTGQVAAMTSVSQQTVIRCCDKGDLKHFRVPLSRCRRIPRRNLVAWAARHGLEIDWNELEQEAS